MKNTIAFTLLFFLSSGLYAQTVENALRFSRTSFNSSGRSAAMGGAFGALGGDVAAINVNPASVGVYRKLEASYSSLLDFSETTSNGVKEKNVTYLVGNLGVVCGIYREDDDNFRSIAFGLTYSNTANFNRKINQSVQNSPSSLTDVYAAQSNGIAPEGLSIFNTGLFYDAYLINRAEDGSYHSVLETGRETVELVNQTKVGREKGYMGEVAIPFGTNFRDKLYMGIVLGIPILDHKITYTYEEVAEENAPSQLDFFNYEEYRKIMGTGVNLKFGIIYRPIPELRFGAAIHSPSWIFETEQKMENKIYSMFTTPNDPSVSREYQDYYFSSSEYDGYNEPHILRYKMQTPWRSVLSFATVLAQRLILSADYEFVNYKTFKYSKPYKYSYDEYEEDDWLHERTKDLSESMEYKTVNQRIKETYRTTHNFRAGMELWVTDFLKLQGGYSFQDSPYRHGGDFGKIYAFSGGFGLNFNIVYCDFAYTQSRSKDQTRFYDYDGISASPILNKYMNKEFRLTFGVKIPTS